MALRVAAGVESQRLVSCHGSCPPSGQRIAGYMPDGMSSAQKAKAPEAVVFRDLALVAGARKIQAVHLQPSEIKVN
jgi:hypothetical protein